MDTARKLSSWALHNSRHRLSDPVAGLWIEIFGQTSLMRTNNAQLFLSSRQKCPIQPALGRHFGMSQIKTTLISFEFYNTFG
jgi:hypothetical protein